MPSCSQISYVKSEDIQKQLELKELEEILDDILDAENFEWKKEAEK